jgi:spore maturation protein CgeB
MTRYANFNYTKQGKCQMKLRDFEVPMAGGFYLVEKAPGYDQCFVDGKEVVMWSTIDELQDKIKYYLIQDTEREQIALAGQKRAVQDHSWQARFNYLFSELGLCTV